MRHQMWQGDGYQWQKQREVLACNFIDDHVLGIFDALIGSDA